MKNLAKIPKEWGLYRPNRKLAVRLIWQPDRPAVNRPGRPPTVKNMTVGEIRAVDRPDTESRLSGPVDRPDTESRALWSG